MKRIVLTIFLVSLLLAGGGEVTKVGTTAAQFLKIGVDARATAMGEAFVAVLGDASATYWNPAGLAWLKYPNLVFTNTEWIAGIKHNYFALTMPTGKFGVLGLSIINLRSGNMEVRTVEEPEGTGELFSLSDVSVALSYGRQFTDRFSMGIQGKYIYEKLWSMQSSTFAFDIGLLYKTQFRRLKIGMNFKNFGGKMRLTGEGTRVIYDIDPNGSPPNVVADLRTEPFEIPLRFQVGISDYIAYTERFKLLYAIDVVHPNDNNEYINVGGEASLLDLLFLRAGFRGLLLRDREGGFSYGAGLKIRRRIGAILLDFSYLDFGRLKNVKRVTLRVAL